MKSKEYYYGDWEEHKVNLMEREEILEMNAKCLEAYQEYPARCVSF